MASYQFDIESDSDAEDLHASNYNSRTVVLGGGRVSYVKQEAERSSAEKKKSRKVTTSPPLAEEIFKPADRIRPVSLPIERKQVLAEKKEENADIAYTFKKIPWQLPKAPLDFPPPLDVPRVEVEKLATPPAGDYTLVNPQKIQTSRPLRPPHQGMLSDNKKNTRFCQFVKLDINKTEKTVCSVENKCRNSACSFAHTMDVYAPLPCTYQAACNNGDTCKFFHGNRESKFDYYMRSCLFPPPLTRVPGQFAPPQRGRK